MRASDDAHSCLSKQSFRLYVEDQWVSQSCLSNMERHWKNTIEITLVQLNKKDIVGIILGPRTFNELLPTTTVSFFSVFWAVAYHAPSAEVLKFAKYLLKCRRGPSPERSVATSFNITNHHLIIIRPKKSHLQPLSLGQSSRLSHRPLR